MILLVWISSIKFFQYFDVFSSSVWSKQTHKSIETQKKFLLNRWKSIWWKSHRSNTFKLFLLWISKKLSWASLAQSTSFHLLSNETGLSTQNDIHLYVFPKISAFVCLCDLLYELCASDRHNSFRFELVMTYLVVPPKKKIFSVPMYRRLR